MELDISYLIPFGIFLLALVIGRPVIELTKDRKERRRYDRRSDRRMKRFRRQSIEADEEEIEESRVDGDRRDLTKERRRQDRRALERMKRL